MTPSGPPPSGGAFRCAACRCAAFRAAFGAPPSKRRLPVRRLPVRRCRSRLPVRRLRRAAPSVRRLPVRRLPARRRRGALGRFPFRLGEGRDVVVFQVPADNVVVAHVGAEKRAAAPAGRQPQGTAQPRVVQPQIVAVHQKRLARLPRRRDDANEPALAAVGHDLHDVLGDPPRPLHNERLRAPHGPAPQVVDDRLQDRARVGCRRARAVGRHGFSCDGRVRGHRRHSCRRHRPQHHGSQRPNLSVPPLHACSPFPR